MNYGYWIGYALAAAGVGWVALYPGTIYDVAATLAAGMARVLRTAAATVGRAAMAAEQASYDLAGLGARS